MSSATRADQLRESGHPVFNDRTLRLGTFGTNVSGGCAMSTVDGVLQTDWASTSTLAELADSMDFEAIVPVGRWRGFGGPTDFNGESFESFTWAAGVGAQTERAGVFATSHVPTIHPVLAAKQATTIDHITGGRFALNVVTGWHRSEIEMFGAPMLPHDERYDVAAEWLDLVARLWTTDEPITVEGKYYRVQDAVLRPQPVRTPHPPIMNAGGSSKGQHFGAKYCDVVFITAGGIEDPVELGAKAAAFKKLAREEYDREISVWTSAYVVAEDTESEANRFLDHYVNDKGDWEAVQNLVETLGINSQTIPTDVLEGIKKHFIAGWSGYPLVGTPAQVTDKLGDLARNGIDGVLLSWARYVEDMQRFQKDVHPLLVDAGLR